MNEWIHKLEKHAARRMQQLEDSSRTFFVLHKFTGSSWIEARLGNKNKPIKWRKKRTRDFSSCQTVLCPVEPGGAESLLTSDLSSCSWCACRRRCSHQSALPPQQVQLWPWSPKSSHLIDTHTHTQLNIKTSGPLLPQCLLLLTEAEVFNWSLFGINDQLQTEVHVFWLSSENEKKETPWLTARRLWVWFQVCLEFVCVWGFSALRDF